VLISKNRNSKKNTAIYSRQGIAIDMLDGLLPHLQDRIRRANEIEQPIGDGPVIVWLKSSLRVHENPAIDVGIQIANQYKKPLLIYQAIDERYPHASLRHHNMLLDGAVDLHNGCKSRGLRYVLHVAREDNRQSVVQHFSGTASCIITDLFPLPPWTTWVRNVAESAECPVIEVDCHCVIPMTMFGKSVDRPFKFRDATKKMRKRLVQQSWPVIEIIPAQFVGKLPFTPVDIDVEIKDIKQRLNLLKDCDIDPTVFPIWQERGGEKTSLSRWQKFLDKNLGGYARRRNDAADPNGVSRLSAAFHYGFLSPMKVAREAATVGTKSAEKYLDELLIFREHAWHHVASVENPYCSSNLPHWAIESWNNTSDDPRPVLLYDHQIEYARSPNQLWNLCQQSLIKHGELHNNLRMTWGKAVPQWSTTLEQSLLRAQKYNDKYALDGRDPSSIAGIQWCHGLFDRPFFPSLPVMGVVRKRDLETHASRLDVAKYAKYINRITNHESEAFIVYGNNLVECYIARVLHDNGINVYHLPRTSNTASVDKRLDDKQLDLLPNYIKNMLKSIIDQIKSNNYSDIAKNLLRGITTVESSKVKTEHHLGESKLYIESHPQSKIISGAFSMNFDGLEILDGVKQEYCQLGQTNDCEEEITDLPTYLWRVVEFIWPLCAVENKPSYAVQMKLI
jgi:deoxyribodipyrimidine photolyase